VPVDDGHVGGAVALAVCSHRKHVESRS
jgi:hypothetical protein